MKIITKKVPAKKSSLSPAKKAVKKVAAKKSVSIPVTTAPVKKAPAKKIAGAPAPKVLVIATNHNSFWMNDGQILNSLTALAQALKKMDSVVYKYHTNAGRHDFANWVEDVLRDVECATALRKAKTVKTAHAVVVKHVALYK